MPTRATARTLYLLRVASAGGTGKTISDAGIQLWRVAVEGGPEAADGVAETRAEKRRKL